MTSYEFGAGIWMFQQFIDRYATDAYGPPVSTLEAIERAADVLQLVSRRGKLVSVELNDNWREWDDDMAVGSVHLIETLEFLYALRQINWPGPLLLDQFPFREDAIQSARTSIKTIHALNNLLDRLDLDALATAQDRQDALAAERIVLDMLLGTKLVKD